MNGVWVYELSFGLVNNGAPVNATFSSSGNQGYFVQSTLAIPAGSSNALIYFYPTNGFTGGVVTVEVNGTTEEGNCVTKFDLYFPECGGLAPRYSNVKTQKSIFLALAPNPTKEYTTVLYDLVEKGNVEIEIRDAMGRIIETINKKESKGQMVLNCSQFAAGYYVVILKQYGEVKGSAKLIVQ
jgi:hypothetical protein